MMSTSSIILKTNKMSIWIWIDIKSNEFDYLILAQKYVDLCSCDSCLFGISKKLTKIDWTKIEKQNKDHSVGSMTALVAARSKKKENIQIHEMQFLFQEQTKLLLGRFYILFSFFHDAKTLTNKSSIHAIDCVAICNQSGWILKWNKTHTEKWSTESIDHAFFGMMSLRRLNFK